MKHGLIKNLIATCFIFIIPIKRSFLFMFKIIALALLSVLFLFQLFVDIKSYLARKRPIPEEVKDVYDEETYLKWKAYSADKLKAKIIFSIITFVISFAFIAFDLYALIAKSIENSYLAAMAVLGVEVGVTAILNIFIFDYVTKMKIEGKYGFNKSSMGTFIGDCIKKTLLIAVLMIGLTCLFIAIYESMGDYLLIVFSAALIVIIIFIVFLAPLLSKTSNRFASLEEGELRTRLTDLLTKYGYKVSDIKVMDASRRTTKSNAGFSGFGKTKTIVLYDNILRTLTNDEIVAVFAHEMGHGLHKDSLKRLFSTVFYIVIFVALAWLIIKFPQIYTDFGFNGVNYGFALILLSECILGFVFRPLSIPRMMMSRHQELKADEVAVKEGYGEQLISGLKKIYKVDLGDLNPDPLVIALSYTHPTLYQRIRNVKELEEK